MVPAQRLLDIPPYPFREIAQLKAKAIAEGQDLVDWGIGDPDQPTPDHIVEAYQKEIWNAEWHRYDETGYGDMAFREAIAYHGRQRFGIEVDPKTEIQVAAGTKDSLALINWAFVNPGDIVLVPDPGYAVYKVNASFAGGTPYPTPLLPENGYLPDLSAIPAEVARQAKLLFLNYPQNPTTAVASHEFFQEAVRWALDNGVVICHDAAYIEIAYEGYRPVSILEVEDAKRCCIEFHSFSKTYNMTGWRLGWSWGHPEIITALSKMKSNVDNGVFLALQRAGAAALRGPQKCVEELCRMYQRRRDLLVGGLNSLGWRLEKPKATFYVWAPCPKGFSSAESGPASTDREAGRGRGREAESSESLSSALARALLVDCGVLVIPGAVYGAHGEGFFRMSLTIEADDPEARIKEGIQRMRDNLELEF